MAARKTATKKRRDNVNTRASANCAKDIAAIKAIAKSLGVAPPRVSETDFGTVISLKGSKFLYLDGVEVTSDYGDSAFVKGWVGFYPTRKGAEVSVYENDMANVVATLIEPFSGRDADDVVGSSLFTAVI
jgi:hypothetical protein